MPDTKRVLDLALGLPGLIVSLPVQAVVAPGDFVTLFRPEPVAGYVHADDAATLGAHSAIPPGLRVAADSFVGAAATVTKDVAPRAVFKAVPAR